MGEDCFVFKQNTQYRCWINSCLVPETECQVAVGVPPKQILQFLRCCKTSPQSELKNKKAETAGTFASKTHSLPQLNISVDTHIMTKNACEVIIGTIPPEGRAHRYAQFPIDTVMRTTVSCTS